MCLHCCCCWGTQKSFAVNNSWNRREIAWTSTVGMVLREPVLYAHCFFFYSHSTCLYSNSCTRTDPEPWGTPNVTAASAHRRPITTTSGCVTLKELLKPSRGRLQVSDKDIAQLWDCFCLLQRASKGSRLRTAAKRLSRTAMSVPPSPSSLCSVAPPSLISPLLPPLPGGHGQE